MNEPWYDQVDADAPLTQGDLVPDCPVVTWKREPIQLRHGGDAQFEVLRAATEAFRADVVVMTQACDLEQEKVGNIILCPHQSLDEYKSLWESSLREVNQNPTNPTVHRSKVFGSDAAILALFALRQGVVIISGGIDLSVGSMISFTGVTMMLMLTRFECMPPACAVALVMLMGAAIGLIHGLPISMLNLQPFLVTLCRLLVFRGLSRVISGDSVLAFDPERYPAFASLGQDAWLGVPIPVYILAAALIPLGIFLHCTVPGRYLFAIGSNLEAARFSGVPVNRLRTVSYIVSAVIIDALVRCRHR